MASTLEKYTPWGVGSLLVLLLAFSCAHQATLQAAADQSARELVTAQHEVTVLRDSLGAALADLKTAHGKVDTLWRTSVKIIHQADTVKVQADSLIALVNILPPDTTTVCRLTREAYDARTTECALLRQAVVVKDSAIAVGQSALLMSQGQLRQMVTQTDSLRAKLALVGRPFTCKVIWFLPCPSRGLSALLGATAGVLLSRSLR